jgi:hypothetical protein
MPTLLLLRTLKMPHALQAPVRRLQRARDQWNLTGGLLFVDNALLGPHAHSTGTATIARQYIEAAASATPSDAAQVSIRKVACCVSTKT